ncbi:long-chain-fatty-acid-CoA ligase [Sistotremastrum niveocremeum HHB9708]|uniref:Long-chain-fatty-acid-CoA ligase n=2 Tax=Sistotremastraceae TaxID=3402574 RepID=A0A165AK24_9AGAM|nr:long-chain-fatty-acid-CoA ligase [Sistotremastrum niveocremeum HHB9708]KZT43978.1 long-chain-fatty-acid-CoA ligase [Sistotremastrum suecicum HHB10207 ss-3]
MARTFDLLGYPANADYLHQGVEVPGSKRPGQTGHIRNSAFPFIDLDTPEAPKSVDQLFEAGLAKSGDKPFLGHRAVTSTNPLTHANHYTWQSYKQIDQRRRYVGSALEKLFRDGSVGVAGELQSVGVWSQNRPEWQIIDLAVHAYNKVGVSLYDTLGPDAVEYIITHANLTIIFASSQHVPTLLALGSRIPKIKVIVSIDELNVQTQNIFSTWGKERGIRVIDFKELEAIGKDNLIPPIPATPQSVVSICYTSGTTSTPKGVVLTHGMLAVSAYAIAHGAGQLPEPILFSYLPLAHIYERTAELLTIMVGGQIGYFTGDPLRLLEDAQILKPTYFPSVPRVLTRVYQLAIQAGDVPGLKGNIFRKARDVKLKKLAATGDPTHPLWDRLVFRKIQAVLGGNLTTVVTGSAPISMEALQFLRIAFCCDVVEGYGMTENCGTCTRTWANDPASLGTVGAPQPCNEIKLIDVPAMNYTSEDKPNPRGELCVRGPNCFTQYYKDPKNTAETVDAEGWLHTGDIAELDSAGRFKIVDRIKNIMKLAQGEYVALEKIENTYGSCPLVAQIYVHGESLQDHLLAVVVPDPVMLAPVASKVFGKTVTPEDGAELVRASQDENVKRAILEALHNEGRKAKLRGFEMVKRIHVTLDPFTAENGLLTPTFKIRRRDAHAKYKAELDALYAIGSSSGSKL